MELTIPPIFLYVASWLGICTGVWTLFEKAESVADKEVKEAVSKWLEGRDSTEQITWPENFVHIFDRIFGASHFTPTRIVRSLGASIFFVVIVNLLWAAVDLDAFLYVIGSAYFLTTIIPLTILNGIPIYLALIETRVLLGFLKERPSTLRILGVILADAFITTCLGLFLYVFLFLVPLLNDDYSSAYDTPLWRNFLAGGYVFGSVEFPVMRAIIVTTENGPGAGTGTGTGTPMPTPYPIYLIWFVSTFFSSLWLWLYIISGVAIRNLQTFIGLYRRLHGPLNTKEYPFRSIGFSSVILVTIVYAVTFFTL